MEDDEPKIYDKGEWVTCRDWEYWYDMWLSASNDAIALGERVTELEEGYDRRTRK